MVVRLTASRSGFPLPPGTLISVRGCIYYRAVVRLEGLDHLENPVTSGIEAGSIVPHLSVCAPPPPQIVFDFCAVRAVGKESRRLVASRTSY
jgi:hypothetical protein